MDCTTLRRLAAVSLTGIAAVGLTACGENAPSVTVPSAQSSSSSSSSSSAPSPSTTSSTSESTTPSSTTSSQPPNTGTAGLAGLPAGCTTTISPQTTTLKFGQPGIYKNDKGVTVCMTVKKLVPAPASAISGGSLSAADGKLYFATINYANVDGTTVVTANEVNRLELHPTITYSQRGKALYSEVPGCSDEAEDSDIGKGQSVDICIAYQIVGATVTTMTYNDYTRMFTWK